MQHQSLTLNIFFFFLFSFGIIHAQNITISGTAIDELLNEPVESATVYLTTQKDSTVIDYSITDKEGKFNLNIKPVNEAVTFIVSDDYSGEFRIDFETLTENKNLEEVILRNIINLEGVVISGAPPIRIKTDTLEFNAASFKVRPDANVEALLKELPGVDIDEDGKITVNGKEVNQILVNGKPFFDKDGKIALQNLPANLINKVQVTDTKTKKEEMSGRKASGNEASINLTIDENKNKGFMLKALLGYGTDERYESSFMANYFKGDAKLSVLGSSNNINSIGFSMNEIFDNMPGGRNTSTFTSSDGRFGRNGISFGGAGNGITQSNLGGINYSDTWADDLEFNGSYFYTDSDTKNNNYTKRQNFLPNNFYTTESRTTTRNQSFNHNLNTSFEFKIDSTFSVWFEPKFAYNKTQSNRIFDEISTDESGQLLNESIGNSRSETNKQTFSSTLGFYKSFKNKSSIDFDLRNNNTYNKSDAFDLSDTRFYQSGQADEIRNQNLQDRDRSDNYEIELGYDFMVSDSAYFNLNVEYVNNQSSNDRFAYDFDPITGEYTAANQLLSAEMSSKYDNINPSIGYRLNKKRFYASVYAGAQFISQKYQGQYISNKYQENQNLTLPSLHANFNLRFKKSGSIYFNYNYTHTMPNAQQILPIENLANPLSIFVGNPDLKPTLTHGVYIGINNYNFQNKTGYNIYAGINYNERSIASYRTLDQDFVSTTTYQNVDGNYAAWAGFNLNKSYTSGVHKFRVGLGLGSSYGYNQGFIESEKYISKNLSLTPRVNFNWDYTDVISINPSYNLRFQQTNYENYRIEKTDNVIHTFRLALTSYWPKKLTFGNDFSYTYNSNISDGFKKDFFLWNTSLAYSFYKDQLSFKVKVYDVLDQNTGDRRTVTDTFISDVQNDVLKRYVMFSLAYKLDHFGGKGKRPGGRNRFMIFD